MARGEGGGRPKKVIDPELVRKLAGIQCTNEEIAAICDCSADTIERRFAGVIKRGKEEGKTSLRRHLWKMVEGGHAGVAIWLSKQHLGMSEKTEVTGTSHQVVHTGKDLSQMSEQDLNEFYKTKLG